MRKAMPIKVKGVAYDAMKEACARLDISRTTMLAYLREGYFTAPPETRQGKSKRVRYFTDEWYAINGVRLENDRNGDQ